MENTLKILFIEDVISDVYLVEMQLKKFKSKYELKVIETEKEFLEALENFSPDIILSDHKLPSFDSMRALELTNEFNHQRKKDIPFILISGSVSHEFAVSSIQSGASDYLMKDRLERLQIAIEGALEKSMMKKRSKIELEKNEKKFRTLLENSGDIIAVVDANGIITYVSPAMKNCVGFEVEEVIGTKFFEKMHPQQAEESKDIFIKLKENPGVVFRRINRFIHKDGQDVWVEGVVINLLEDENVNGIVANYRDITARRYAEEEKTKLVADIFQRNSELEQFAYIISHNLRAPVANIMGFTEELKDSTYSSSEKELFVKELSSSVNRLDEVIVDLNSILSSKQDLNELKEEIFLTPLVNYISIGIIKMINTHNAKIKLDFDKVPVINSVKSYIHSIFLNLITNSIKYMQPEIPPVIEISSEKIIGKIRLKFKDNGIGIDLEKNGNQVFGLYKRFHRSVEGKGMGLFMVKSQVESLGGSIAIKSSLNSGTEFIIELPENIMVLPQVNIN